MNRPRTLWIAGALALAAGTAATVAVRAQDSGGGRVPAAEPAPAAEDYEALVRSLGDPDFGVREKAYARLREAGEGAREAVEEGARSEDPQIRWSAGRLLRLLDREGDRRDGILRFRDREDPRRDPLGELPRADLPTLDRFDFSRTMEGLRRRMEELERRLGEMPDPFSVPFDAGTGEGARVERHVVVERDGERTGVDVSPDGRVKVSLTRKAGDGSVHTEEFEAESLEALAKEHPEVHARVKGLLGNPLEIRIGRSLAPSLPRLPDPFPGRWLADRPPGAAPRPDGPRLGVLVEEVPAVLRAHLPVGAEEGLVVEEVLEGTLAERMELRRHDVILSVNGIPVSSARDVADALGAVEEGEEVRVRLLRGGRVTERSTNR